MPRISKKELKLFLHDKVHPDVIKHVAKGGNLLDILTKGFNTASDIAKKGIEFYNKNKGTIDKAFKIGKNVVDNYKRKEKGGAILDPDFRLRYNTPPKLYKAPVMKAGKMTGAGLKEYKPQQALFSCGAGGKMTGAGMKPYQAPQPIKAGKMTGAGVKKSKAKSLSPWIKEVMEYHRTHPRLTYREAMMECSKMRK